MIRPYSPIAAGTRVSVELKHGDRVTGVAQWSKKGLVGITFDTPIDVLSLLSASGLESQARMPRIELGGTASLRHDGDVYRARVVNISQGGICVTAKCSLPVGADVTVSLPGLPPAAGTVKWTDEGNIGVGFNSVFAVDELMAFLREQQRLLGGKKLRAAG
jgi:PilZ domain